MAIKFTEQSSLNTTGRFNPELADLRQRAEDAGYDIGDEGLCEGCGCGLTEVDVMELGACTQCGMEIFRLSDESGQVER